MHVSHVFDHSYLRHGFICIWNTFYLIKIIISVAHGVSAPRITLCIKHTLFAFTLCPASHALMQML